MLELPGSDDEEAGLLLGCWGGREVYGGVWREGDVWLPPNKRETRCVSGELVFTRAQGFHRDLDGGTSAIDLPPS